MANATVLRLRLRGVYAHERSLSAFTTSALARVTRTLRVLWCTLNGGHYRVLHVEPSRMALRCVGCGQETPGWEIGATRPTPRYAGDPERFRLERQPQAIGRRATGVR